MDHDVARKLLSLVNNKQNMDRLSAYVNDRLALLHQHLETCATEKEMSLLQGQIKEVRRLLTLREEATQRAEEGKH